MPVEATKEDPSNPGADDWRPSAPSDGAKERAALLAEDWGRPTREAKGKPAPVVEDDDDLDETDDTDALDDQDEDEEEDLVEAAPAKKRAVADVEAEDDDEDEADDEEEEAEDEEDPDADLDEEDERPAKDPKVAKGLAALQRQEKRMREQIDRERESVRGELAQGRQQLEAAQAEIAKAKAKYEGLADRAKLDPFGVLEELGVDDDEYIGKQAFARTKAKTDPAFKEAAAKMKSERALRAEVDALKADKEQRAKTEEESRKTAAQKAELDRLIGGIAKEAKGVSKATLTNRLLKSDAGAAQSLFAHAHLELWKRDGVEPTPRKVVIAAEKMQREQLRKYGIDPRTLAAAVESEKTSSPDLPGKAKGKVAKGKAKTSLDDELRRPTKAELLEEDWTSGKRTR